MASAAPLPTRPITIAPNVAHELLETGKATTVDVRSSDLFVARHIPGAMSIPLRQLGAKMTMLPRDKLIIFY